MMNPLNLQARKAIWALLLLLLILTIKTGSVVSPQRAADIRVTGDIFIVYISVKTPINSVEQLISPSITQNGRAFVKIAANPISYVQSEVDLHAVLQSGHSSNPRDISRVLANVIELSEQHSNIFLVVDEDFTNVDVDIAVLSDVFNRTQKRVDVVLIKDNNLNKDVRHKRQVNLFQLLANLSGGSVIHTDKNNIGSAVDIIKQNMITSQVNIMKFMMAPIARSFKVPVDNTVTKLIVTVQVEKNSAILMGTSASNIPARAGSGCVIKKLGAALVGSTVTIMECNITKVTDYGQWTFNKFDRFTWDVTVKGESPIGFTHEFMEQGSGGIGEYPIKGLPIAGSMYKLVVTVPEYDKVQTVSAGLVLIRDSVFPIDSKPLTNIGGRRGQSIFYTNFTMPINPFMIGITGSDKLSKAFQRIDPMIISPINIRLSVPPLADVKLYTKEILEIPFTVVNEATTQQDIDVKTEDDKQFLLSPNIISATVKAGENFTGKFKIKGGLTIGETTTITITAKLSMSPHVAIQAGQYEIRRFTVEERPTKPEDKINPTCNITLVNGDCNIGSDLCACSKHMWSMDVEIGDEGFGVREIFATGAGNSTNTTFKHENFTQGHNNSMGAIKATLESDCCHQTATIQVVDMAGNTGACQPNITQNFKPLDPNLCDNSTLNITIPCKKTQTSGLCNFGANPCDCHKQSWHLLAEFDLVGWNITQAFTVGAGSNASLLRTMNIVDLDVSCCHQHVLVHALDIAGNIGQCNVSLSHFITPTPDDCTTTTMTTTTTTTTTTTSITTTTATSTHTATNSLSSTSAASAVSLLHSPTTAANSKQLLLSSPSTVAVKIPRSSRSQMSPSSPTSANSPTSASSIITTKAEDNVQQTPSVKDSMSNNAALAVGSGIAIGAVLCVAAIGAMALIFRKILSKVGKKVEPSTGGGKKKQDS